jgi:methylmalonyl-CoA/ethylmalonyl-CoA epimerase
LEKISTNHMVKIGIVVANLEEAVSYYTDLFDLPTQAPHDQQPQGKKQTEGNTPYVWYRGEYRNARCRTAVIPIEPIYLELIEPLDEPSPWTEFKN